MPLSEEQLRLRLSGIGSSEVAAVAGLSPYEGQMAVWLRKRGLVERSSVENDHLYWGSAIEPIIRQRYERDRNVTVVEPGTLVDKVHPFVLGTPDGIVPEDCAIEIKCVGARSEHLFGEPGTGDVPPWYAAQCAWVLRVVDLPRCDMPVLFGGNRFAIYRVERDLEFEEMLISAARRFWVDHVLTGEPPPLDASDETSRYLARRYPSALGPVREANAAEAELLDRYRRVREACAKLEQERTVVENELRLAIGEASGIRAERVTVRWTETKGKVSWKNVVEELSAPPELVEKHRGPGHRRLVTRWERK